MSCDFYMPMNSCICFRYFVGMYVNLFVVACECIFGTRISVTDLYVNLGLVCYMMDWLSGYSFMLFFTFFSLIDCRLVYLLN